MSLKITYRDTAKNELDVDLAKFAQSKEHLCLEFARIVTIGETGEAEGLEVCARLKLPIESALQTLVDMITVLIVHEREHSTGYGISVPQKGGDDSKGADSGG